MQEIHVSYGFILRKSVAHALDVAVFIRQNNEDLIY